MTSMQLRAFFDGYMDKTAGSDSDYPAVKKFPEPDKEPGFPVPSPASLALPKAPSAPPPVVSYLPSSLETRLAAEPIEAYHAPESAPAAELVEPPPAEALPDRWARQQKEETDAKRQALQKTVAKKYGEPLATGYTQMRAAGELDKTPFMWRPQWLANPSSYASANSSGPATIAEGQAQRRQRLLQATVSKKYGKPLSESIAGPMTVNLVTGNLPEYAQKLKKAVENRAGNALPSRVAMPIR